MGAVQASMQFVEEIWASSRNVAAIVKYDNKLTQLLGDFQVLLVASSHMHSQHLSPALPSEVLAKA
eukprot:gene53160-64934_t